VKFLNQNLILMEHSTTPQSNWFKLQQSTQNCKKKKKKIIDGMWLKLAGLITHIAIQHRIKGFKQFRTQKGT